MKTRHYLILFLLSLVVISVAAAFETSPGYMDAEYYYAGGVRLAEGHGFSEPFLWNYLDSPSGIPHPSHVYWMPLASLVAALGMALGGTTAFAAARMPFILLSGAAAPLTAWGSYRMFQRRGAAILSGLMAVFSGFYLPYSPTTDTFALYMLLGSLFILCSGEILDRGASIRGRVLASGGLGLTAGLMHLARADGILWIGIAGVVLLWGWFKYNPNPRTQGNGTKPANQIRNNLAALAWTTVALAAGYLLIMSPWFIRNLQLYGLPFSPGTSHTLWLTQYDQMFALNPADISFGQWVSSGIGNILRARLDAGLKNLQTAAIVQGGIFLVPLILAGGWQHRKAARVQVAALAWGLTFLVMTVVFPFAGYRGGFLHSGAAVQPLIWALAAAGLESFVRWGGRVRRWNIRQAWGFFAVGVVALTVLMTGLVFMKKVIGDTPGAPVWNQGWERQVELGRSLDEMGIDRSAVFLVNDPPGFYLAAGRSSIVIPYGDETAVLAAAAKYHAGYLLIDENHVDAINGLYDHPVSTGSMTYLTTIDGTHLFKIGP